MMTRAPSLDAALLRRMFDAAIAAAQPALCVPPALPAKPEGRLIVIGAARARGARERARRIDQVTRAWPAPRCGRAPGPLCRRQRNAGAGCRVPPRHGP